MTDLILLALLEVIQTGVVDLRSFDSQGNPNSVTVSEFSDDKGINHARDFRLGRLVGLPYGTYKYRVRVGRTVKEGFVVLHEPQRLLVLHGEPRLVNPSTGAELEPDSGPPASLDGKYLSYGRSDETAWLRIQSVHDTSRFRDAVVGVDGRFAIRSAPPGKCLLILFLAGEPLSASLIDLPPFGTVRVEIEGDPRKPTIRVK